MTALQIDIEDKVPTPEYLIMNGHDDDLELEIDEVIKEAAIAIRQTMRMGKLIRIKKGKPFTLKSFTPRQHLAHAYGHAKAALGGDNIMNEDSETGLPNLFHLITRSAFALHREKSRTESQEMKSLQEARDE